MRATHDQQVTTLFDGEPIAPGCRGRCSSQVNRKTGHGLAVAFALLLIGFTTAATAITARRHAAPEQNISAGANLIVAPGVAGFETAIY